MYLHVTYILYHRRELIVESPACKTSASATATMPWELYLIHILIQHIDIPLVKCTRFRLVHNLVQKVRNRLSRDGEEQRAAAARMRGRERTMALQVGKVSKK